MLPSGAKSVQGANAYCRCGITAAKKFYSRKAHTLYRIVILRRMSPRVGASYIPREEERMKEITIYTDGACSGNPGPGGWGAVLRYGAHEKELSGSEASTTNNRMELLGVITALEALSEPCRVDLYSDSKYVVDGIEKGWAVSWRARGWIKPDKKPAKNPELWARLLDLLERHQVTFHWVKGHAENRYNNRCDELAVAAYQKYK